MTKKVMWLNRSLSGYSKLFESNNSWMSISLISTFNLETCDIEDHLEEVLTRKELERFDYIPVCSKNKVVGALNAEKFRQSKQIDGLVNSVMDKLDQSILISANADILSFLKEADTSPYRLVLDGTEICGIVTISDLQQLPVRSVLFSLITYLELLMAELIRQKYPNENDWIAKLTDRRQQKVEEKWDDPKYQKVAIDKLTVTEFCDKRVIIEQSQIIFNENGGKIEKMLKDIQSLRDSLAHAGDYAATSDSAKSVAKIVRYTLGIISSLKKEIQAKE